MGQMMRITLVGGTGFIGQHLGQALAKEGHKITVTTRNPSQWTGQMAFPCEVIGWNPEREAFPLNSDALPDTVINLAGAGVGDRLWTKSYQKTLRDSRLVTTRKIVERLTQERKSRPHLKPIHLTQASAVGYYGSQGDTILTESSPQGEGFLATLCGDWEQVAMNRGPSSPGDAKIPVSIVRIGVVLGWGGGFLNALTPLYMRGIGSIVGTGKQWLPWIHVEDLVEILKGIATTAPETHAHSQEPIIYNATAPEPMPFHELHRLLCHSYGSQFAPPVPGWLLKGLLQKQSEMALLSQRVIPERLSQSRSFGGKPFVFRYQNSKQAFEALFQSPLDRKSFHVLSYQWLPLKRQDIWPFFTTETNLETLTPPWLNFKVLNKSTPAIEEGTTINYQLKLHGVPLAWQTEIRAWQPGLKFIDHQIKGPYALWDHTHAFEDLGGGTLLTDHIRLRLPFGKLGFLVGGSFVLADVKKIFDYRRKKIAEIFGATPHLQGISGGHRH